MKLIDPGIGDVLDRLTILSLKITVGREQGKDVTHFEREQTALLAKVRSRDHSGPWFALTLELATINALLWHAEDDLRALREQTLGTDSVAAAAVLGFRIQALNDQRADRIAKINKEAGDQTGPEKV